jgi:hypothetical protein
VSTIAIGYKKGCAGVDDETPSRKDLSAPPSFVIRLPRCIESAASARHRAKSLLGV